MGGDAIDTLKPILEEMAAADVDAPDYPVAFAIADAQSLLKTCLGAVRQRLVEIGVGSEDFERLELAIDAVQEAQSAWLKLRDQAKSPSQIALEQEGYALRADLFAACHFNLREDRLSVAMLDAIIQDEGPEALIEDLACLSRLIETRVAAFDDDLSFDAEQQARRARELAAQIRDGLRGVKQSRAHREAKDLRDRAFTLLDDTAEYVRDAGLYAFRREPETRERFASLFLCRRRRRRDAQPAAVTVPKSSTPPI